MITLTTCFLNLVELEKDKKLVSERFNSSNGHNFFLYRLGVIEHFIDIYQTEISAHRQGWWRI